MSDNQLQLKRRPLPQQYADDTIQDDVARRRHLALLGDNGRAVSPAGQDPISNERGAEPSNERGAVRADEYGAARANDGAQRASGQSAAQASAGGFAIDGDKIWINAAWFVKAADHTFVDGRNVSAIRAREIGIALGLGGKELAYMVATARFYLREAISKVLLDAVATKTIGLRGAGSRVFRGSDGGLDVFVAAGDLEAGSQAAITPQHVADALHAAQRFTGLDIDEHGAKFASEDAPNKTIVGNGVVHFSLSKKSCQDIFGDEAFDRWHHKLPQKKETKEEAPAAAKMKLQNFYNMPVPGEIINYGGEIEHRENVWYAINIDWPTHTPDPDTYQMVEMATGNHRKGGGTVAIADCEWTFAYLGDATHPPAMQKTRSTKLGEVAESLALPAGVVSGTFMVSVMVHIDAYFAPRQMQQVVEVRTTAAHLQDLHAKTYDGLANASETATAMNFSALTSGSGDDIHGRRFDGEMPPDFARDSDSSMIKADRARLERENQDLKAMQARLTGDNLQQARAAVERQIIDNNVHIAGVGADVDNGWQSFAVRGDYFARTEYAGTSGLQLSGVARADKRDKKQGDTTEPAAEIVIKLYDNSKIAVPELLTFEGRATSFDEALRRAFVDLSKQYPDGIISMKAEQLISLWGNAKGVPLLPKGTYVGFEIGTSSTSKRFWDAIYNSTAGQMVGQTLMLGGAAISAIFPPAATIVLPIMTAYGVTGALVQLDDLQRSGRATFERRVVSAIDLCSSLLPFVGQAKNFSGAWFLLEGASTSADAFLLHAAALEQSKAIQSQLVQGLAATYQTLKDKPPGDPAWSAFRTEAAQASTVYIDALQALAQDFAITRLSHAAIRQIRQQPASARSQIVRELDDQARTGDKAATAAEPSAELPLAVARDAKVASAEGVQRPHHAADPESTDRSTARDMIILNGADVPLRTYASKIAPLEGYIDVVVHADEQSFYVARNLDEVALDHRRVAAYLEKRGMTGQKNQAHRLRVGEKPKLHRPAFGQQAQGGGAGAK